MFLTAALFLPAALLGIFVSVVAWSVLPGMPGPAAAVPGIVSAALPGDCGVGLAYVHDGRDVAIPVVAGGGPRDGSDSGCGIIVHHGYTTKETMK